MYEWSPYKEECQLLYVQENRSLEAVMDYFRLRYSFTPSRRAFQWQFKKWGFPSKQSPAYKNERLVARTKELWEQNLTQKEILRILNEEDGFSVDARELTRLRYKQGLRMRLATAGFGTHKRPRNKKSDQEDEDDDSDSESDSGSDDISGSDDDGNESGEDDNTYLLGRYDDGDQSTGIIWATKKRRRRTRGWAGLPADPPGPPRFPSETTLEESKVILQLSSEGYTLLRNKFQAICEEAGVIKKTLAGPEKWEALKDRLVRESMHLRAIMWDQDNIEQKKLAIDVIACDVTKRMRVVNTTITVADAKTILGLNPEQGRAVRASLYKILVAEQFKGKLQEGLEHWDEIRRKWLEGAGADGLVSPSTDDPEYARKVKAIDILARDSVRRHRDDMKKVAKLAAEPLRPTPPPAQKRAYGFRKQPAIPIPAASRRPQRVESVAPPAMIHTQSRLLPPELDLEEAHNAATDLSAIDPQLDTALLLSPPEPQHHSFVDDDDGGQYVQSYVQEPPTPVYHHQPAPSTSMAIYLRLHPASAFPVVTPVWIAALPSRSVDALRNTAVEKYPGVVCLAIEGIIKDGKGGELPLPVSDDVELDAYLQHVPMGPTFSVQLVPAEQRDWV
ncbi:hypothetical protein B0T17DRAFT_493016 [Bombardia bombarda]|uniref:Clr5 domain-containing protein n=1 Tax=Bombardia bombarda TaxID=252184 RepID=A0AA40C4E3_9PEZI|nr:hypothetical protein B0T17DRAFT_493016 [Bombardia bombarda]